MRRFLKRALRGLVFLLLVLIVGFGLFRYQYSDDIRSLAQTQVRNSTSDLINDAIDKQIDQGNIQYDRIIYFEKNLDGQITALKTNMEEVNRLKTSILNYVNDEILALDTSELSIPVGSLVLPEFFSGRGPGIPIQVISIRNSDGSFQSYFTEAGINQTIHQLIMEVVVDVTVLVLGEAEEFTVSSHVVVAETVIVGQVPNTFFQNGGNDGS